MDILSLLDYAVLQPDAGLAEIKAAVDVCKRYGVGNLCVKSADVARAKRLLADSQTTLSAVVGFPHGGASALAKAEEASLACIQGATEIDMVANIARIKENDADYVINEIAQVVTAVQATHGILKVILETALLTETEIIRATEWAIAAKADYVKTSTGFAKHGATPEAVACMVKTAQGRIKVKASGGIHTRKDAEYYLSIGASRLGVGNVVNLLTSEEKERL